MFFQRFLFAQRAITPEKNAHILIKIFIYVVCHSKQLFLLLNLCLISTLYCCLSQSRAKCRIEESSELYFKGFNSLKFHSTAVKIGMEIANELIKFICNMSNIFFFSNLLIRRKKYIEMSFFRNYFSLKGQ